MPLYQDIENRMLERISGGDWPPGTRLANEFVLADEFGVSQGTVRKALSGLEARGLVQRRPRHGTVVAEQTDETALYAFFRLRDAEGAPVVPEPHAERVVMRAASASEAAALGTDQVWTITRSRLHHGVPFSLERIVLPVELCPGLDGETPLPNSLYPFLEQRFRISIDRIEEDLSAVAAVRADAEVLGVAQGTPLMRAERRSFDLRSVCVELRDSLYVTEGRSYSVRLGR